MRGPFFGSRTFPDHFTWFLLAVKPVIRKSNSLVRVKGRCALWSGSGRRVPLRLESQHPSQRLGFSKLGPSLSASWGGKEGRKATCPRRMCIRLWTCWICIILGAGFGVWCYTAGFSHGYQACRNVQQISEVGAKLRDDEEKAKDL
jgi:hypothetical protein